MWRRRSTPNPQRATADASKPSSGTPLPYDQVFTLIREMSSLEHGTVIARALELLKLVSGAERGLLVGTSGDGKLTDLASEVGASPLEFHKSLAARCLETGETMRRILTEDGRVPPSKSMQALNLRHVWVRAIRGTDGRPIAAVYLDSRATAEPLTKEREEVLEALVEQISVTLRNVLLHQRLREFNDSLERKVIERTRELEQSQSRLVSQERHVALGRLVAGIAHELNNPAGAIVSLARTTSDLATVVVGLEREVAIFFEDPHDRAIASSVLHDVVRRASDPPVDSKARREREESLRDLLAVPGQADGDGAARRLARAGLRADDIASAVDLLRRPGEPLSALAERLGTFMRGLQTIGNSAATIARIVEGLKTYSHLDRPEFEPADVHRGLSATLEVMRSRIPPGVQVITRFAEIPPFLHRPGELTQVWTNLIDNALYAMGDRGFLTVETLDLGEQVRVSVTDTGGGVPRQIAPRVFELHVTSRGPGAGLGLGLPICRKIVESHGGHISFESQPGHTVFVVELPKTPGPGSHSR